MPIRLPVEEDEKPPKIHPPSDDALDAARTFGRIKKEFEEWGAKIAEKRLTPADHEALREAKAMREASDRQKQLMGRLASLPKGIPEEMREQLIRQVMLGDYAKPIEVGAGFVKKTSGDHRKIVPVEQMFEDYEREQEKINDET